MVDCPPGPMAPPSRPEPPFRRRGPVRRRPWRRWVRLEPPLPSRWRSSSSKVPSEPSTCFSQLARAATRAAAPAPPPGLHHVIVVARQALLVALRSPLPGRSLHPMTISATQHPQAPPNRESPPPCGPSRSSAAWRSASATSTTSATCDLRRGAGGVCIGLGVAVDGSGRRPQASCRRSSCARP